MAQFRWTIHIVAATPIICIFYRRSDWFLAACGLEEAVFRIALDFSLWFKLELVATVRSRVQCGMARYRSRVRDPGFALTVRRRSRTVSLMARDRREKCWRVEITSTFDPFDADPFDCLVSTGQGYRIACCPLVSKSRCC